MAAPTDQRAGVRPIAFLLDISGALLDPVTLKIRPEDLTRTEQSRATVHQTLGRDVSGWVDNFGAGLPSVSISGHTGWRASGISGEDGVAAFERLNNAVMPQFHRAKQVAVDAGRDPASVKLLFVDMLDNFAWSVVPMQFVLRRSKSRPLLMQYNITLQAVSTSVDNPLMIDIPLPPIAAGLDSLTASINAFTDEYLLGIRGWVSSELVAPVTDFMKKTSRLYSAVGRAIRAGLSIGDQLIVVARGISQSGMNIFRTLSMVASIPALAKAKLIQIANEYGNIFCLLNNALRSRGTYQNYSPFYGASNCSSTSGGRPLSPLSGQNPFYSLFPIQPDLPVRLSSAAQSALTYSATSDVVLNPMSPSVVGDTIRTISAGMTVT